MFNDIDKIGLGSVQWGLKYGVSNSKGQSSPEEVSNILKVASSIGIKTIDTASSYGNSEKIIGQNNLNNFNLITKISSNDFNDKDTFVNTFYKSLDNLGLKKIYALLLHNCDDLFTKEAMPNIQSLKSLQELGLVQKIGFSAYNSNQIRKALKVFIPDIVQLPFNVFDQRVLNDGTLEFLKEKNIEIHSRSCFLQGLLIMNSSLIPRYFLKWSNLFKKWDNYCKDISTSPKSVALSFATSQKYIDKVIIGFENSIQLSEIINTPNFKNNLNLKFLKCNDEKLINPSEWKYRIN